MSDASKTQEGACAPVLKRFEVTAHAVGDAICEVEAADEDEAVTVAFLDHLHGVDIGCGGVDWEIDHVHEVEA